MGLCSAYPSLWLRQPVMVAWVHPARRCWPRQAAASASGAGVSAAEAVGAFMVCAALITLSGLTGLFERPDEPHPTVILHRPCWPGRAGPLRPGSLCRCRRRIALVLLMLATSGRQARRPRAMPVPATLVAAVVWWR